MTEREDEPLKNNSGDGLERSKIDEKIHSNLIPKIGIEFESEDAAYTFYNSYACKGGFRIRRAEVDLAESCGITPKASCELMARRAGGRENLGFIPDDYSNYLRSKRTIQMRTGDTCGMLEYLQRMQLEDPNFFYSIQVDEDDLITNIFWADAKMMVDYSYFGDIVCFDTTYKKNREGRPFAMFVGVNHHKLSIIFGATLLYDETAETFVWLFNTFSKAVLGKKPQTILTDQDAAMAKALKLAWPKTCHRLCIWHLYENAMKKLSHVFAEFCEFSKDLISAFMSTKKRKNLLKLGITCLTSNSWLEQTFGLKEKWALVYGRHNFCPDMTITQRSESINNLIKKYRLVQDHRYEETKVDFKASQRSLTLSFDVEILRHASTIYTLAIFKMIQFEPLPSQHCELAVPTISNRWICILFFHRVDPKLRPIIKRKQTAVSLCRTTPDHHPCRTRDPVRTVAPKASVQPP
ncbi:PREDICTED: protein FAR1-RELATED SEQUENCE 5-like [Lupinus angustifolius]|uniref:protein FAR1-RELATED SEQUENCE 5-like n=1 Tax=Lupinus angustifolius TaxID=3871 RepID=UPI00092F0905|nr:PREDICTED: protein FAR1-RELATED SEQUENCE 5-like [Lupinus angustifolius]